ncbi:hypothetical protein O181_032778 [Austropuccinia psidii MF-1]|uniref:Yeast cell wall synthesis Kre9/Knh1-like N-terminal domain-containing protein n=1 Tax=Austropuccinia psidii MF-1 TaxID=1389203 RepID=A0A9Q3D2A2_9BASI|nr:hypothetical protein [Austropuccinia psidii MF-1]
MIPLTSFGLFGALIILKSSVWAIQVTAPIDGADWNLTAPNEVSWASTPGDPTSFTIDLVNMDPNCYPTGMTKVLKQNVSAADGTYKTTDIQGVKSCGGYQINLVSLNGGILAQSVRFNITTTSSSMTNGTNTTSSSASTSLTGSSVGNSSTSLPSSSSSSPQTNTTSRSSQVPNSSASGRASTSAAPLTSRPPARRAFIYFTIISLSLSVFLTSS